MICRFAAFLLFASTAPFSLAQQALPNSLPSGPEVTINQTMPESAWIDLRQNTPGRSATQTAPEWVEAVTMTPTAAADGTSKTVFRVRVSHPTGEFGILFLRLFFDDKPDARPELVAWDESGTQVLRSRKLGTGVNLPTSDSIVIPMGEITAVDIEVPGDGKTIRGVYLDWMTSSEVVHPINTEQHDLLAEPFSSLPALHAPKQDKQQFGTVTASLASETISIGPSIENGGAFQFGIEAQPLLALLTFEVASPRIDSPPEVYVNGEDVGPVTLAIPDLADPGYRGESESMTTEMHFQYTGWLRAQKVLPVSNLKTGPNDILIIAGPGTPASAIRATQVQLKYLWEKSDYLLKTQH
jgi:hypothetical protein